MLNKNMSLPLIYKSAETKMGKKEMLQTHFQFLQEINNDYPSL